MKKLSVAQKLAYARLDEIGGWVSSYRLGASLSTMRALRKMGLVTSEGHLSAGAFYCPQVGIQWKVCLATKPKDGKGGTHGYIK